MTQVESQNDTQQKSDCCKSGKSGFLTTKRSIPVWVLGAALFAAAYMHFVAIR